MPDIMTTEERWAAYQEAVDGLATAAAALRDMAADALARNAPECAAIAGWRSVLKLSERLAEEAVAPELPLEHPATTQKGRAAAAGPN